MAYINLFSILILLSFCDPIMYPTIKLTENPAINIASAFAGMNRNIKYPANKPATTPKKEYRYE
jgi:hypothetical protein